jgi:hypothetical protein
LLQNGCARPQRKKYVTPLCRAKLDEIKAKLEHGILLLNEWNVVACFFRRHLLGEDIELAVKLGGHVVSGHVLSHTFTSFYEKVDKHNKEGTKYY